MNIIDVSINNLRQFSLDNSSREQDKLYNTLLTLSSHVFSMTGKQRGEVLKLLPMLKNCYIEKQRSPAIQNLFQRRVHPQENKLENFTIHLKAACKQAALEHLIYKRLKPSLSLPWEEKIIKASLVAGNLNSTPSSFSPVISPFYREPLSNLVKKKGLEDPIQKYAKLVSYERFYSTLRINFLTILSSLIALSPQTPPPYIILGEKKDKSTNWTIAQVLDLMTDHPPQAIVFRESIRDYLLQNPHVSNILMIDDGAYSGSQAQEYLLALNAPRGVKLHICIPYMTNCARQKIEAACHDKGFQVAFSPYQLIFSYREYQDLGYFGYTRIERPIIEALIEEFSIPEEAPDSEEIKKSIHHIQSHLFKWTDDQLINEVSLLLSHLPADKAYEDLKLMLEWALLYDFRMGVNKSLAHQVNTAYMYRYPQWEHLSQIKTPTWLAHKATDEMSSMVDSMRDAVETYPFCSPYHTSSLASSSRSLEVRSLETKEQKKKGYTLNEEYAPYRVDQEQIVVSNRGIFLIACNYIRSSQSASPRMFLSANGYKFPFGGVDGMLQYKIEEGVPFSLENMESPSSQRTLVYENGHLLERENPA